MPMWAAGSERGLTLLELLVVLAVLGAAGALVSLALRDPIAAQVEEDARRLAALLEVARADARRSGLPVRWQVASDGFRFDGLQGSPLPQTWVHAGMQARVEGGEVLLLGPEPVIGPQAVQVFHAQHARLRWQVRSDGVRPFLAQAMPDAGPP